MVSQIAKSKSLKAQGWFEFSMSDRLSTQSDADSRKLRSSQKKTGIGKLCFVDNDSELVLWGFKHLSFGRVRPFEEATQVHWEDSTYCRGLKTLPLRPT